MSRIRFLGFEDIAGRGPGDRRHGRPLKPKEGLNGAPGALVATAESRAWSLLL